MELKSHFDADVNGIDFIAVAIKKIEGGGSRSHVGVFYKTPRMDKARFCHLAWHHALQDDLAENKIDYKWFESDLQRGSKKGLVAFIMNIIKKKDVRPIPYGYLWHGLSFSNDGVYIKEEPGEGLTCATFILDVFGMFRLALLQEETWPERDEDEEWRQFILGQLKREGSGANDNHIKALEEAEHIIRFRPEEVAAGYAKPFKTWPNCYEDVVGDATALMKAIS